MIGESSVYYFTGFYNRMKVVYEPGKVECGTILNPVTLVMRARYMTMIKVSLK